MAGLVIEFGHGKGDKESKDESMSSDSYDGEGEALMEDFLSAVADKNPKDMWNAIKAAHALCETGNDEGEMK